MVAPRSGPASSPAVPAFLSGRGRMALGRLCPSRQSSLHKAPFDSPRPGFLGFESRWRVLFFLSWPRGAEVFTPRGGERELGFPSVPPDNPRGSQVRAGHSHFVLPGSAANVCTARDQDDTQQTENSPAPLRAAGSEPRCLIHEMGADHGVCRAVSRAQRSAGQAARAPPQGVSLAVVLITSAHENG